MTSWRVVEFVNCKYLEYDATDCNDANRVCQCITRNHENKEIFNEDTVSEEERRRRYYLRTDHDNADEEMVEIDCQRLLDVIHCSFLHNAISDGAKFVTTINMENESPRCNGNDGKEQRRRTQPQIVDAANYEFGIKFNFHDSKSSHFCGPKYFDLRDEMLSNSVHALSIGVKLICERLTEFLESA